MKPSILLVEDETNILKRFPGILFGTGQRAERAGSRAAAKKKMDRTRYDLVICRLKNLDEAHDMLKEIDAQFPSTRTIFLSNAACSKDCQRLLDSGAVNRFLQTPVHKRVLRAAIAEQLRLNGAGVDQHRKKLNSYDGIDLMPYPTGGQTC